MKVDSDGEEEKCSKNAIEQSEQPYSTMTLQEASIGFSNLSKGISLDEVIDDNDMDEEEFDFAGNPNHNVDDAEPTNNVYAAEVSVNGFDVTGLPKGFKLTDSQKECVAEMRKEMEKGQMLVFVHRPPGSGKTTTARLLVSEKNLNLAFSGTTGTASSLYKAETINTLLHLGRNVEDFEASQKRVSAHLKSQILSKFGDARILIIDEVSMLSPVMLALIDLRLRQCFNPEKPFGGLLSFYWELCSSFQEFKKAAIYQAAV